MLLLKKLLLFLLLITIASAKFYLNDRISLNPGYNAERYFWNWRTKALNFQLDVKQYRWNI